MPDDDVLRRSLAKLDDDEAYYRSLPDPEMRDDMLRCVEVERAYLRGERTYDDGMATAPEPGMPVWVACTLVGVLLAVFVLAIVLSR